MKKHAIRPSLERFEARTLLSRASPVPPVPSGGGITPSSGFQGITAELTTNHAVYKVGQTVDMQLTLTNRTHHKIELTYSNEDSPFSIQRNGRFVWDGVTNVRDMIERPVHVEVDPGTSTSFTGRWTPTTLKGAAETYAPGVYSLHSEIDPGAAPRVFRVIGPPKAVPLPPGRVLNPGGQLGTPGGGSTGWVQGSNPGPGRITLPIIYRPVSKPVIPNPFMPPIVDPTPPQPRRTGPILANGIHPIVRP